MSRGRVSTTISIASPSGEPCGRVVLALEPGHVATVGNLLAVEGYEVVPVDPEPQDFEPVVKRGADVLLVDEGLTGINLMLLVSRLTVMSAAQRPRILLVSREPLDEEAVASALDAGADDCVSIDRPTELRARVRVALRRREQSVAFDRVRSERNRLRLLAFRDALTEIPNRRSLDPVLANQVMIGDPFAILFVDIDRFKSVNDTFGHAAGDEVLRRVARSIEQNARPGDFCCRYGGEEFVIVAPGLGRDHALRVAERHRAQIAALTFEELGGFRVTVSIGVAIADPATPMREADLLCRADQALYEAKRTGRDRTVIAERESTKAS